MSFDKVFNDLKVLNVPNQTTFFISLKSLMPLTAFRKGFFRLAKGFALASERACSGMRKGRFHHAEGLLSGRG